MDVNAWAFGSSVIVGQTSFQSIRIHCVTLTPRRILACSAKKFKIASRSK